MQLEDAPDLDDLRLMVKNRRTRDSREWGRLVVALTDKIRSIAESFPTSEEQYQWLAELRIPHFAVETYGPEYEPVFDGLTDNVEIKDD